MILHFTCAAVINREQKQFTDKNKMYVLSSHKCCKHGKIDNYGPHWKCQTNYQK